MLEKIKASADNDLDKETEDLATLMFNMALMNSGFNIDEPVNFTATLQKLVNVGFGLDRDEPVEEIEIDIEDEPAESDEKDGKDDNEEEIVIDADKGTHTSSADEPSGSEDKADEGSTDDKKEEEAPKDDL